MTRRAQAGFGAAALLALALVGFVPQPVLARAPVVTINTPANGATLTQPVSIGGVATMENGWVDWVELSIESTQGDPVPATNHRDGGDATQHFSWAPPLSHNGIYKIKALAQGTDDRILGDNEVEFHSVTHTVNLNVPAAAPTGVKTVVNQAKRTVVISWNANPEPDLQAYGVFRKTGDDVVQLHIGPERTYTDALGELPAGSYTYQVFAARSNAANDGVLVSAPSAATAKVTSSPPPPPTTVVGGGSGGGATTTTAPGNKPPSLATRGKADLSGFASLLPSGGARLPTVRSTPAPDAGFDSDLPFDGEAPGGVSGPRAEQGGDGQQSLGEEALASSDEDQPSSLRFMAAGLLVTVVLMHLLWLRGEVNRDPLPAIAPDETPER